MQTYALTLTAGAALTTMSEQTNAGSGRLDPIQSLSARVRDASRSADLWNDACAVMVAVGLIVAAGLLFVHFVAGARNRALARAQSELMAEKDRVAASETQARDLAIETAKQAAAEAGLEQERIRERLAWRTVSPKAYHEMTRVLSSKPGAVTIAYVSNDPETINLATQLGKVFGDSGWKVSWQARTYSFQVVTGILIPEADEGSQLARDAFSSAGIGFSTDFIPPGDGFQGAGLAPTRILVGSKPAPY
jgi:hypothetical protein